MRNKYSYIGAGLLCVAALTSCSNEEIISEKINAGLTEYTVTADANFDKEAAGQGTRANVKEDGKSFIWNKGDKLTLWNGTQGYTFQAVDSYDESIYYSKVEFKGEASFEEGQEIWGIYPCKESPSADNVFTFTLPQPQVQEGTAPALQKSMCMYAKGTVSGNTVSNMVFQHLTGTLHFNLTNKRGKSITLKKIVVSTDSPVFPSSATLNTDGTVSYSGETKEFELSLNNQSVSNYSSFEAYASVFPTNKMTRETKLTISVLFDDGTGEDISQIIKEGTVGSLYREDTGFAQDGYKYVAGKRYGISRILFDGDPGYDQDGNTFTIRTADGLSNALSDPQIVGNPDNSILLNGPIDMQGTSLTPVENFAATLDGYGYSISNYQLSEGTGSLIKTNSGTIQNLTLENITFTTATVSTENDGASAFVGKNNGTIANCEVNGITLTLTGGKAAFGAIVGFNAGTISDVIIETSTMEAQVNCNAGFLAGINTGKIVGCYVGSTNTMKASGSATNAALGGLVGWAQGSSEVYACGSSAKFDIGVVVSCGGLIAANVGKVELAYSGNTIEGNASSGSSIGAFVRNANENSTYTKCYTTTATTNGFYKDKGTPTFTQCFTTGTQSGFNGGGITQSATVEQIKTGLKDQSVTIGEVTYKFVENTGSDSSTRPLIIEKQ